MSEVHFPEKYAKKLKGTAGDLFKEEVEALDADGLKQKIVEAENALTLNQRTQDADAKLEEIKLQLKDLTAGYKDVKGFQTAKLQYCLYLLESRGADMGDTE
jgi:hypothetical protein